MATKKTAAKKQANRAAATRARLVNGLKAYATDLNGMLNHAMGIEGKDERDLFLIRENGDIDGPMYEGELRKLLEDDGLGEADFATGYLTLIRGKAVEPKFKLDSIA